MFQKRIGLAVWLNNLKMARQLRRLGNVHYVSRKMRYAIVYIDAKKLEETLAKLKSFHYVKKVEVSQRHELNTEFKNPTPDQAKEYDYKMGY